MSYFNPRSHEGSDRRYHRPERDPLFQSTLPRGERHGSSQFSGMPVVISIHAPTRGATHGSANQYKSNLIFQSTLPRGERRLDTKAMKCNNKISIHAPTRGATVMWLLLVQHQNIFQSTLPRGERLLVMLSAYMS